MGYTFEKQNRPHEPSHIAVEEYLASALAEKLDAPFAEYEAGATVAMPGGQSDDVDTPKELSAHRPQAPLIDLQRTFLVASTAFVGLVAFTFVSSDRVPVSSTPGVKKPPVEVTQPTEVQPREDESEVSTPTENRDAVSTTNGASASSVSAQSQAATAAAPQESTPIARSASALPDVEGNVGSVPENTVAPANALVPESSPAASAEAAPISTPVASERPTTADESSNANTAAGLPAGDRPTVVMRSSARVSNHSIGGQPLDVTPRPGSKYISWRNGSGSSHEAERLSRAIESGGNSGRDLADLYQQRALLFLNHGEAERAVPDFQKAIELFSAMIKRGERVREARDGLNAARNGLRIASDTQVY